MFLHAVQMQKLMNGVVVDTRLFPQCKSYCAISQSVALRRNVRKLVIHRVPFNGLIAGTALTS